MKAAVQGILLLACIAICTSQSFMRCRCIRTIPTVRRILIADVIVYEPRPACHKFEVVAVMKNNRQFCLDPESDFTKRLLRDKAVIPLATRT
ncbi:growth-regulated alpha protein-like [Xiphophorus maculatus]|uniref:growth-regulated alpha protein-like n=1 Tax=Xiphophorus maculatus TaxID=8083 RepID=UPI0003B58A4C|nr:growth-regulated alpha protein-like [Xiphophorus maculatus]